MAGRIVEGRLPIQDEMAIHRAQNPGWTVSSDYDGQVIVLTPPPDLWRPELPLRPLRSDIPAKMFKLAEVAEAIDV